MTVSASKRRRHPAYRHPLQLAARDPRDKEMHVADQLDRRSFLARAVTIAAAGNGIFHLGAARAAVDNGDGSAAPRPCPFKLPLAFTAGGFDRDDLTPAALATRLHLARIPAVAIQINGETEAAPADAKPFRALKVEVYLWGIPTIADETKLDAFGADAYIPQVETDEQYSALIATLHARVGEKLPRTLVTTLEGVNTGKDGFPALPQEHRNDARSRHYARLRRVLPTRQGHPRQPPHHDEPGDHPRLTRPDSRPWAIPRCPHPRLSDPFQLRSQLRVLERRADASADCRLRARIGFA